MKDKSFFKRIFIMLIAMEFVLLVGVLTVQGYVVSKSSMDEMSKSSEDKLGVIRGYTEVALKDIEKTTLYIALDENISVLDNMRGRELSDTDTVLELYKLVDFLKLQKSVDNRIDSIYIYHDELDLTVTSDGDICRNGKPADTEWKSFYDKESGFFWTGRRVLKKGMENYDVITLVYPFKNINSSTNYAVVANVSLNALSNVILSEYNAENSSVCIIDTNGQTIAGTLDERYDADIAAEISDGESIVKDGVLYTCEVAENNGWKYVNAMPVRFPDNQSRSIIAGILAAGCCMLIVGVLISYFISKRIARPIEQLMRKLNVRKQGDEFEIINEAFEAVLKKEKYMRGLFGETDVKEEYLKKCLTGDIYKIDSLLLGAENDCAGYALAVASVSNFARFAARFSDEDFSSVSSMIKIMGEKSFQQLGGVVGTQTDSNVYVWLVCIKSGASGGIFAAAEELRTGMTELCGVDVTVVINEELASLDDVPEIFRICMQTRAEYIMYSCGGVLDCEGLPGASGGFEYPAASEKQITGCVDMNDRNGYVDAISDFFAAIRDKRPWSGIVRTTVNQLLGTLMSYILQDASGMPEIFGGDLYAQLAQIETLDEMELFLSNVGVRIIACREETGNANESYIGEIVDFIHRNYHRDISVSDIAGSVNLSYSHVRKIFFEKMNTTILLYINNLRIEEAKKLLSETRKAISEIAVEIGYNNDQSFSRYFKKATGITPGEWRRRKLGENQRKDNI